MSAENSSIVDEKWEERQALVEAYAAAAAAEADNGMADPADTDASKAQATPPVEELSFDEKMEALTATVTRQTLMREIMYRTLAFCQEEKLLRTIEEEIATWPEFAGCPQNQYFMVKTLVKAHGLQLVERDEFGAEVTAEQKEGLTEDEIDDLVCTLNYRTTDVGRAFVELHSPKARLVELLNLNPARNEAYINLLKYVDAQPRTYDEIKAYLAGNPALETIIDGHHETMQPSVFVDKLECAGALVWNKGWELSSEGKEYLQDLQSVQREGVFA